MLKKLLKPKAKREAVRFLIGSFGLTLRRSCGLVGLWRSSCFYRPRPDPGAEAIRQRLKELAQTRPTWGCLMLHAVLKREGLVINHKRTERIYREEKLSLKLRRRKKKVAELRTPLVPVENPNERWSMDFIHARLIRVMSTGSAGDRY